jgi:hypothetical protein
MTRGGIGFVLAGAMLATFAGRATADGKNMRPALSTDEQAAAALAVFEEEFKAKGLKGDDRTSQRDFAMSKVVKVQHARVVEALAKVSRSGEPMLRTLGVLYLGEQRALPGTAGKEVLATLKANRKDTLLVLSALDSFGNLRYVGAGDTIRDLMRDQDFSVKKSAIIASGRTRDVRLLPDLLKLLGIDAKADGTDGDGDGNDGPVVTSEGYSWEGAEASVDTGTPGPGDQQAAEAAVEAQLRANEAAARASAGGGGGVGGGTGGGISIGGGRGGSSRSV